MNQELKQALQVIKKYASEPKQKSFSEHMNGASLKQRIATLRGEFTHYVDHQTIWYRHNQNIKNGDDTMLDHPCYTNVELTEKQRKDCLQELQWFLNDVKYSIGHLTK